MLETSKNVVWQSADGRVTSDHCRVTVQWLISQNFLIAWNIQKRCLTVGRRSRDLDNCGVTVQRLFSKFSQIAWNVQKTLFDSRPTVAWPQPLSRDRSATFVKIFPNRLKRLKTLFDSRPTVAWPQPLSRDRSATFFKIFPNRLKRPENVVWQSADGRVTSDHCRVTVQRLFSKIFLIAWNVQKALFDSRPTVAWPPTTVAWPFSDFFNILPNCLKRPKNVVWQSADGRVTSDHCRVTVQRLSSKFSQIAWNVQKTLFDSRPTVAWPPTTVGWPFSDFFQKKKILIAWNVEKSLFDSRPTVAWPPTTVAWPFSDFFQNFRKSLETSRKRCLTVGRRSRDLRLLSRDRSVTFFKNFPNCLKRPKNVVWQSADGRVTSTTVAWPFSDFFQNFPKSIEMSKKRCLTVGRRSRDLRPLSRDRSATFFENFYNCLKRPKNVVWQSADGRVTSDHCRVTVQWLFQHSPKLLETSKKRCLTVSRRSRDLRPLSRDRSATFFKIFANRLKRPKNVVWQSTDGRVTSDHCRVTV